MDYQTKNNSKMLVIICPTTGATPIENINAILHVVELSGGIILEPCKVMEDNYYNAIARAEEQCSTLPTLNTSWYNIPREERLYHVEMACGFKQVRPKKDRDGAAV